MIQFSGDDLNKRMWNADETGLCLDTRSKTDLAWRGAKSVYEIREDLVGSISLFSDVAQQMA